MQLSEPNSVLISELNFWKYTLLIEVVGMFASFYFNMKIKYSHPRARCFCTQ